MLRTWQITSAHIHYTSNDSHHLKIDLHFLRLLSSVLPHSSGDDHKGSPHRQKSSPYPTWLPTSASMQLASSLFMRLSPSRLGGRFSQFFSLIYLPARASVNAPCSCPLTQRTQDSQGTTTSGWKEPRSCCLTTPTPAGNSSYRGETHTEAT